MQRFLLLLCVTSPIFAQCTGASGAPEWNGWGADASNSRFQPEKAAQIPAAQVPNLKLKWAFGFPGVRSVMGQPTVAGGRIFIGMDTGEVYALDESTGAACWTYKAEASVRNIVSGGNAVYFGDRRATVYAVNVKDGKLLWKVKADDHPTALITGGPRLYENKLYVPVASGEEGSGGGANYACCTFRGSVVALDPATGKQIWKTYVIPDEPKQVGTNPNGVARWAPAGGGVWNSPTIDPKRHALYVGTGDSYSEPAAKTTDAIVAMDLDTGKTMWSVQDTENDTWLSACMGGRSGPNCPKTLGPDHDFGSPPILVTLAGGRQLLVAGQKSGNVWAHDPDAKGAVIWRTALVNNTTEFGGKIIWGGAADGQNAYFGLGTGGIAAVQLRDGEKQWFTALQPAAAVAAHTGQDGPLTAIPGIVFSGGWDGVLRALSTTNGRVVWEYNTVQNYQTVNGVAAKGGSMGAPGPVVSGGMLLAPSGYIGVKNGLPGNVVLAFAAPAP